MIALATSSIALLLAGGGIREAQIAIPPELVSETEVLQVRGLGGGSRGSFTLGSSKGRFIRSAERLGLFDPLVVRNRGRSAFTARGPEVEGELSGRCGYSETQANLGDLTGTPKRLTYSCRFSRDGDLLAAELVLRETNESIGSLFSKRERRGSLYFEGARIEFRSLHRDRRGGLPMATPLGYAFYQGGRQIGAIDLNGSRKRIHAPTAGPDRAAVIAASLALSVFWDPAEAAPDE